MRVKPKFNTHVILEKNLHINKKQQSAHIWDGGKNFYWQKHNVHNFLWRQSEMSNVRVLLTKAAKLSSQTQGGILCIFLDTILGSDCSDKILSRKFKKSNFCCTSVSQCSSDK